MAQDDKGNDEKRPRRDGTENDEESSSSDRDVSRETERAAKSKGDFTDIGTDAQQADGTAAGPSTS